MTPKLKLNELARNTLLWFMLKFLLPGSSRISRSTHITLEPRTQAIRGERPQLASRNKIALDGKAQALKGPASYLPAPLTKHKIHPRVSLSTAAHDIMGERCWWAG